MYLNRDDMEKRDHSYIKSRKMGLSSFFENGAYRMSQSGAETRNFSACT